MPGGFRPAAQVGAWVFIFGGCLGVCCSQEQGGAKSSNCPLLAAAFAGRCMSKGGQFGGIRLHWVATNFALLLFTNCSQGARRGGSELALLAAPGAVRRALLERAAAPGGFIHLLKVPLKMFIHRVCVACAPSTAAVSVCVDWLRATQARWEAEKHARACMRCLLTPRIPTALPRHPLFLVLRRARCTF